MPARSQSIPALPDVDPWRQLADTTRCAPFLRPEWISAYLSHYEPTAKLMRFDVREAGELIGALPLIAERCVSYGIPVRRLRAPVHPSWPDRFDIACAESRAEQVATNLWRQLGQRRDWDVIELADLPERGPGWRLLELAKAQGRRVGTRPSQPSPFIAIGGDRPPFVPSKRFLADLRRSRRNLEKHGAITLRRATTFDSALLDQFFHLEHAGWKGAAGTSIQSDLRSLAHYRDLAQAAADRGYLAMYALEVDDTPIAMHFGLEIDGVYYVPKLAYDERFREFSPGHLLIQEVVADCRSRGLVEFDFLGAAMPWKMEWTDQVRRHYRVHIFNRTIRGRLAHASRYRVLPRLRRLVSQGAIRIDPHDRAQKRSRS